MTWTPVGMALDELASAVADAGHTRASRAALAEMVLDLEHAAGSTLGGTAGDPRVLLLRRFSRAHRLLLTGARPLGVDRVRAHVLALQAAARPTVGRTDDPATATGRSRVGA